MKKYMGVLVIVLALILLFLGSLMVLPNYLQADEVGLDKSELLKTFLGLLLVSSFGLIFGLALLKKSKSK